MMEAQLTTLTVPASPDVFEATFKWQYLTPTFMIKCQNLINLCAISNIEVELEDGFISLQEQAALWTKGKTKKQIEDKVAQLRTNHADYLADIIENTEIVRGFWHTDDIPGFSWHNWGTALTFKISPVGNREAIITQSHLNNLGVKYHNLDHIDQGHYSIQMQPKSVEKTYDLKYVNDHFKGKNNK